MTIVIDLVNSPDYVVSETETVEYIIKLASPACGKADDFIAYSYSLSL